MLSVWEPLLQEELRLLYNYVSFRQFLTWYFFYFSSFYSLTD